MSEYWVSKKKYWCQYCEIYIADDAPSRAQHENGLRHKGNKDRFIRGLYKAGVKKKQESEEEKREMKRVEEAAQAAYARDVGAGLATSGASSSSTPVAAPKPKPPPPKPSDPYSNYTTAASLGITDPEVDRLVAEAEMRKNEGRAGDWIAVAPPPPPLPQNGEASLTGDVKSASAGVRKREEEPVDDDDTRRFKIRKKTVAVGLGEIYDPGIIRIKPRVDPAVKAESDFKPLLNSTPLRGPLLGGDALQGDVKGQGLEPVSQATERPAWTRREWKWAGEDKGEGNSTSGAPVEGESGPDHRRELDVSPGETIPDATKNKDGQYPPLGNIKKEESTTPDRLSGEPSGGSMFRKRKLPGGSSTRGRRAIER